MIREQEGRHKNGAKTEEITSGLKYFVQDRSIDKRIKFEAVSQKMYKRRDGGGGFAEG